MADEIPSSFQLTVNGDSLPGLVLVDQMADQAESPPLRLVPVGGGQFLLAKMAGLPPEEEEEEEATPAGASAHEDLAALLSELQAEVLQRLDTISNKLSAVEARCGALGDRMNSLAALLPGGTSASHLPAADTRPSVTVCVPSPTGGTVDDYPNGCWLGNPDDPDMRVRVPISPSDLEMMNRTCSTPEKMALTLLDYLFDRETQASSNISGTGRHGKQQLDPLRIFAIRCHLLHHFAINDQDWHRIKQNMDSKCRTAFRRKHRGMPLNVKAFRERGMRSSTSSLLVDDSAEQLALLSEDALCDISGLQPQIIRTEHGDIQVVQATAEQLAQMEQDPHIHILASTEVTEVLSCRDIEPNEVEEDLQP